MSDLERLFRWRATQWMEPLENFTTEALAIAISHDFRPMKEALRQVDWSHSADEEQPAEPISVDAIVAIDADTQRELPTESGRVRRLDLVLSLHRDGELPREVWIEVKVNAWVSGDQLEVYLEQAALRSPSPSVITLARTHISNKVPALKWAAVARAIETTHDAHSSWAALSEFLNEQHIASPPAPTHVDAASCIEVIVEVNRGIERLWKTNPKMTWRDGDLINAMKKADPTDLMAAVGPLWFGLKRKDHRWQWNLIVSTVKNFQKIPMDPNDLLQAADSGGLPDQWARHPESRDVLQLVAPFDDDRFIDRDEIVAWFDEGLRQLRDAGILESFMAGLRRKHGDQAAPIADDGTLTSGESV